MTCLLYHCKSGKSYPFAPEDDLKQKILSDKYTQHKRFCVQDAQEAMILSFCKIVGFYLSKSIWTFISDGQFQYSNCLYNDAGMYIVSYD